VDRGTPKDKSVGAALALTFFFGPFGMLYSVVWWAALLMMVGAFFAGLLTFFIFGVGAGVFWAASMVWGAVAASNKHSVYCAWLAAQPQTFVAAQSQSLSGGPLPASTPAQSPPSPAGGGVQRATAQLPPAPEAVAHPPAGSESPVPNREEEALLGLKRLSELGLISEQEASAKRAEILSRLFPSSPADGGVTTADTRPDQVADRPAEEAAACDRTAELPATTVPIVFDEGVTEPLAAMPSQSEAQKAVAGSSAPLRRSWLVAGVVAALVAAVALAGTLFVLSRQHRPTASPTAAAVLTSTPSPSPTSYRLVRETLPVEALQTEQPPTETSQPLYPDVVTVEIPQPWANDVSAYGLAGSVFIAPAGWYGSGSVGQDGSSGMSLHSDVTTGIPGTLEGQFESSGEGGYASADAAAYFPWVRKDMGIWGSGVTAAAPRTGLTERFVGRDLAWYAVANSKDTVRHLQDSGIAQISNNGEFSFDHLEVTLPATDRDLAKAILNWYLSPQFAVTEGVCFSLNQYFDGVNSQDYQESWQEFSRRFQQQVGFSQWASGMSTASDSNIEIHYVRSEEPDLAIAYVTFTSFQDPSQGPNGDTQDNWTLDYRMKRSGWQWLIDYAGPHNGSTHTSG